MKLINLTALSLLVATPLLAHPGHEEATTATHWIGDASHLAVTGLIAALACVAVGGGIAWRRAARRKSE